MSTAVQAQNLAVGDRIKFVGKEEVIYQIWLSIDGKQVKIQFVSGTDLTCVPTYRIEIVERRRVQ